jgi:hypothetical protein
MYNHPSIRSLVVLRITLLRRISAARSVPFHHPGQSNPSGGLEAFPIGFL